jgi:hypothetical protein
MKPAAAQPHMIVLRERGRGRAWSCPGLTTTEAYRTANYWFHLTGQWYEVALATPTERSALKRDFKEGSG